METYPLDIDPEQLLHWIREELELAPSRFVLSARKAIEIREIPFQQEIRLGDEEREDLSEAAIIATLEIAPGHAAEGWKIAVVVEDEGGPRIDDVDMAAEAEQEIDLDTFHKQFNRPSRGTVNVVAEVDSPAAKARITRLISMIETNRHG